MAPHVLNCFRGDTTVGLAVEMPEKDFVASGSAYWRNRGQIFSYFYLQDGEPYLELTIHYSLSRLDMRATATLPLSACKSIKCFRAVPYDLKGLDRSSPKLQFWQGSMDIHLPSLEKCRENQVSYVCLSLTRVPAMKFVKVDLEAMQPDTAGETILETLTNGTEGEVEFFFAYGKHDQMARPIHANIEHFVSRCTEIGESKKNAVEAARLKRMASDDTTLATSTSRLSSEPAPKRARKSSDTLEISGPTK